MRPFPLDQWHPQPTAGLPRVKQGRVGISLASGAITLIMGGWGDANIGVVKPKGAGRSLLDLLFGDERS